MANKYLDVCCQSDAVSYLVSGESGLLILKMKVESAHCPIGAITTEIVEIEKFKPSFAIIFDFCCPLALTMFLICFCHHMTLVSFNIFT